MLFKHQKKNGIANVPTRSDTGNNVMLKVGKE